MDSRKEAFERAYVTALLERAAGNITRAARMAGIHRGTLHDKLKRLGIVSGDEP